MAEMSSQEEAAPKDDFVHLHVHTDYSMLDGAGKIKDYVAEAKRLGQPALAITDHGYMFGAYEFYAAATGARQGADLENESISSVCQKGVVCQCSVKKTRRGVLSVARR